MRRRWADCIIGHIYGSELLPQCTDCWHRLLEKARPREHRSGIQLVPTLFVPTSFMRGGRPEEKNSELTYRINEFGYRGPSFSVSKPEGTRRIIVLGGSAVFDPNADGWPHLTQDFLKTTGHENVEVINAGVPGHASFDSLGRLYSQIWTFEPDYVLVYHGWNDIKYFKTLARE